MRTLECPHCKTDTVVPARFDPPGVQLWRCSNCHEIKRWCPRCDQGWITRVVVHENGATVYLCDECDAMWPAVSLIASPGDSFGPYFEQQGVLRPWSTIEFVREFDEDKGA